ncbi:hypothetical protein CTI12_AA542850 [Artemisia annua]|uniref:RNA-directed DNA polymerase, eukaryota, Reverse transcriptase zinc-binding domain protein n=1 Tax=Artemisia annua TaxID=35608 RepID=A0A2U1L0T0_ARTAN|nr:hypothetical protein CTI12_AA542850 [Artemisia annua]
MRMDNNINRIKAYIYPMQLRFFHLVHRIKKNRNSIIGLNTNSQWVAQPNIIKEHIVNHFSNLFSKEDRDFSWFPWDDLELLKLPTEFALTLEEDLTTEDAWRVIKDCEGEKEPRSDEFTIGFIKFAWKTIKEDLKHMQLEGGDWRVASRITWLKQGDKNSRFFHLVHRIKKNRNSIIGLNTNSQWVAQPNIIKEHIVNHFSNLFSKEDRDFSWFPWDDLELLKLPTEFALTLEEDLTIEDAWRVIKDCEGEKAPRPDEFTIGFIKFAWKTIKEDRNKVEVQFKFQKFQNTLKKPVNKRVPKEGKGNVHERFWVHDTDCNSKYKCDVY